MNWQEFFAMGGYAFYVWTSYGITFVVMVAAVVVPVLQRKQFMREMILKKKRRESI